MQGFQTFPGSELLLNMWVSCLQNPDAWESPSGRQVDFQPSENKDYLLLLFDFSVFHLL